MQDAQTARGSSTGKNSHTLSSSTNLADFIPQAGEDFVATPAIQELTDRALAYIDIGYAVHLSGPAGTGKTTLALHIASKIGRRCTLLHGDDELRGSDLLGRDSGYRRQSVRDNYVSSILKTEETVSLMWTSNRLTTACEQGHTVIYDEFTRSPAAANNAFLSILEEGILNIPSSASEKNYVRVHPDFRVIFTSNPEEYVGVHKSQDALIDRMITLEVSHQDRETELAIVRAKSRRSPEEASMIVDIVRAIRERTGCKSGPTIRAALAIARILDHRQAKVSCTDPIFISTCQDVLCYNTARQSGKPFGRDTLLDLMKQVFSGETVSAMRSAIDSRAVEPTRSAGPTETYKSERHSVEPTEPESRTNMPIPTRQRSFGTSTQLEASPAIDTAERVMQSLQTVSDAIESPSDSASANIARAGKDPASRISQEMKAVEAKASDELSDGMNQRESVSRRLMRPPAFETLSVPMGSAVSSK